MDGLRMCLGAWSAIRASCRARACRGVGELDAYIYEFALAPVAWDAGDPTSTLDAIADAVAFRARSPMMLAILQEVYGPEPERVLRVGEIEVPSIGDDEVLVRVRAASVDRGTWHIMAGLPYPIRAAGFGLRAPKYSNPGRS